MSHFDDTLFFHQLSKVINTLLTLDNLHVEILTVIQITHIQVLLIIEVQRSWILPSGT